MNSPRLEKTKPIVIIFGFAVLISSVGLYYEIDVRRPDYWVLALSIGLFAEQILAFCFGWNMIVYYGGEAYSPNRKNFAIRAFYFLIYVILTLFLSYLLYARFFQQL